MKCGDFQPGFPGRLVPINFTEYPEGVHRPPRTVPAHAYIPNPLPPSVDWARLRLEHFELYTQTIGELGRLNGLHKRVGNACKLVANTLDERGEALLRSRRH